MLGSMARKHGVPLVYVNQFGGNDDLVFDGRSCAFDAAGAPDRARPRRSTPTSSSAISTRAAPIAPAGRRRRRNRKSGARWCSARATTRASAASRASCSACRAASTRRSPPRSPPRRSAPANVLGVLMPSPYSSRGSVDDARALAANLGIETLTLPIEPAMQRDGRARCATRSPATARDVTEENIQARIRGNLLMALSNKRGALLLTTGNKSELVGRLLHALRRHVRRPRGHRRRAEDDGLPRRALAEPDRAAAPMIPEATLTKAPSAELRPNQTDQDSLPPYDVLDDILQRHIEQHQPADEIIAAGFDADDRRTACCGWCASRSSSASRRRRA